MLQKTAAISRPRLGNLLVEPDQQSTLAAAGAQTRHGIATTRWRSLLGKTNWLETLSLAGELATTAPRAR